MNTIKKVNNDNNNNDNNVLDVLVNEDDYSLPQDQKDRIIHRCRFRRKQQRYLIRKALQDDQYNTEMTRLLVRELQHMNKIVERQGKVIDVISGGTINIKDVIPENKDTISKK